MSAKRPLWKRPKLNSVDVAFGTTPKSLSALLVQLNPECDAIASPMKINAATGVIMPAVPANRSQDFFLVSDKTFALT